MLIIKSDKKSYTQERVLINPPKQSFVWHWKVNILNRPWSSIRAGTPGPVVRIPEVTIYISTHYQKVILGGSMVVGDKDDEGPKIPT
jgi:hypothetical protein